jgi:predicted DNA-binding transcriptional regulator AlpA
VKTGLQVLRPSARQTDEQRDGASVHRGRLLTATQVAAELFSGTVSAAWVRRQVPHKVVLGHSTVRWFEHDVQAWIANQRCVATTCESVASM